METQTLLIADGTAQGTPDLATYDFVVVAFSGGKDSVACVLHLLELGVPAAKIILAHHEVDGREADSLMDWPSTPGYCRAVAATLGLRLTASWKVGGFEREMLRDQAPTAPTTFETHDGRLMTAGGKSAKIGTRLKFPQTGANLCTRWCSAYLKVDVMDKVLINAPEYQGRRTLVVTGERADESPNRSRYKIFEPHRVTSASRHIDHWRPVHAWNEAQAWEIMRRNGILPHMGYVLGWSRLSCITCIFASKSQWATIRAMAPERFARIAAYEAQFGVTINRTKSIVQLADEGTPYAAAIANPGLFAEAMRPDWTGTVSVAPADWVMPAGAFGEAGGPT